MKAGILFFVLALAGICSAVSISACTNLNTHDTTYTLTANINYVFNQRCMNVSQNNVVLDCAGFYINGNNQSLQVDVYALNVLGFQLKNCVLYSATNNVVFDGANNSFITNTTSAFPATGSVNVRFIGSSHDDNITNSTIIKGADGIRLQTTNSNIIINNSQIINSTAHGIEINSGATGIIVNNTIISGSTNDALRLDGVTNSVYQNIQMTSQGAADRPVWLSGSTSFNNLFDSVTIANAGAECIRIGQSGNPSNTVIQNSVLTNCTDGVYTDVAAANLNMTNVTLVNMTNSGIRLTSSVGGGVFTNNAVYMSSGSLINQTAAVSNSFSGMTFGYNSTAGVVNYTSFTIPAAREYKLGSNIFLQPAFVSVNTTANPELNTTAKVILTTDTLCSYPQAFRDNGFHTTRPAIYQAGGSYTAGSCSAGVGNFTASTFGGYTFGYAVFLMNSSNVPLQDVSSVATFYNISFIDQNTLAALSVDQATLSFSVLSSGLVDNTTRNYSVSYASGVTNAIVDSDPGWTYAVISGVEYFTKSGYAPVHRVLNAANFSLNQTNNVTISLLPLTSAEYAVLNVVKNGEPVAAYVDVLKFFPSSSGYTLVDQVTTNGNGQAVVYADQVGYYKFNVYDSSRNLLYASPTPEQFICNGGTCSATINIGQQNPLKMVSPYPFANCYGNVGNNSIVSNFADATGITRAINFLAYRENVSAPVCNSTTVGSSAGNVCVLPPGENLTKYLYVCQIWRNASPAFLYTSNLIDYRTLQAAQDWLLPALMIVIVLALMAYAPVALAAVGASPFILTVGGILAIPPGISITIMFVFFILAFLVARGGRNG